MFGLSDISISDYLESDNISILFNLLDYATTTNISGNVRLFTGWQLFHSLVSDLISSKSRFIKGKKPQRYTLLYSLYSIGI